MPSEEIEKSAKSGLTSSPLLSQMIGRTAPESPLSCIKSSYPGFAILGTRFWTHALGVARLLRQPNDSIAAPLLSSRMRGTAPLFKSELRRR